MDQFGVFLAWWNRIARSNQKVKFRSSREAADFVRHMVNASGPNAEMVRMREDYVAIQKARSKATA
jgi:hypothetical protein